MVPAITFQPAGTATLNPPDTADKASLRIDIPANAILFVDGNKTETAGVSRQFHTPVLVKGQDFYYDLRAEVIVEGKTIVEEKKVIVRAGANVNESFSKLIAAVAKPRTNSLASK